jgi:RNA polymerase sigma factor (TIGR02999 family)
MKGLRVPLTTRYTALKRGVNERGLAFLNPSLGDHERATFELPSRAEESITAVGFPSNANHGQANRSSRRGGGVMSETTRNLTGSDEGQNRPAEELLPVVYDELRHLAAQKLSHEKPGQTLQATALVHEAWLRLGLEPDRRWNDPRHFFCAAADAMRRILIENARRKRAARHGGGLVQTKLPTTGIAAPAPDEYLLAVDEALAGLSREDPQAAELVKLRFFVGLPHREAAEVLGLSHTKADRSWLFAKAWLAQNLKKS